MLNIVIPMAGSGARFAQAGYTVPKPFIDVAGKPMIVRVMENLAYKGSRFFLIARREHLESKRDVVEGIRKSFDATFIPIETMTEGIACSVLHARRYIDNDQPLLIANSDQIVDIPISLFIEDCARRKLDGSILTFIDKEKNPKWSFVKVGSDNLVLETREKAAISEYATVGIYLFSRGATFVDAAIDMIIANDRTNNEFYTCPVFNYAIKEKKKIGIFNIEFGLMHGLGTPDDLQRYLKRAAGSPEPAVRR